MAKTKTSEKDAQHELSRRALIKWSLAAGAALGVSRSKIYEILEKTAGKGVAQAADQQPGRSVHLIAGGGGLAWFSLLWPHLAQAQSTNPNTAWHKPGTPNTAPAGTDKPLWIGPDTPWADLPPDRQVSLFLAGNNQTHTDTPQTPTQLPGGTMLDAITAFQVTLPAVVPSIYVGGQGVGNVFGNFPGRQAVAGVNNPDGIVNLFNSAASQAGGILSNPDNANLYKVTYSTLAEFTRAGKAVNKKTYETAAGAAGFLGTNLASALSVTPADRTRYGVNIGTRSAVADIAEMLIIAVKAFKLGLTNQITMNVFSDDPHGAFGNGNDGQPITSTVAPMKTVLNAFMQDLRDNVDGTGQALDLSTIFTVHGDTTKDPMDRNGWPDGTQDGINVVYAYLAGYGKTGWFGRYPETGTAQVFDPATGGEIPADQNGARGLAAQGVAGAALYAVTRGDVRAASGAAGTSIDGIINAAASQT